MEERRNAWTFVTEYLSDEFLGKHSYLGRSQFKASQETISYFSKYPNEAITIYGHWIPNSTCYGLTLPSNETITLECTSADRSKHAKNGCFHIVNPKTKEEQIVCSKVLDEGCVGVTTPMNWSVALACYHQQYKSK